jgi:hypothetical protein
MTRTCETGRAAAGISALGCAVAVALTGRTIASASGKASDLVTFGRAVSHPQPVVGTGSFPASARVVTFRENLGGNAGHKKPPKPATVTGQAAVS